VHKRGRKTSIIIIIIIIGQHQLFKQGLISEIDIIGTEKHHPQSPTAGLPLKL